MDYKVTGCEEVDWIDVAQDRVNWQTCDKGDESSGSIKVGIFLIRCLTVSFIKSLFCGVN
jgi:hypothetical protein